MMNQVSFSDIGLRLLLRCGARYVGFWKTRKGQIYSANYRSQRLRDIVCFAKTSIIKKDKIDQTYQLIDLANVEPGTGYLVNIEENTVDEIGSDKVLLKDADIAFSKLNSHLGYVFLLDEIPKSDFESIGSTEFYILNVDKSIVHPKILKYILINSAFRETAVFLRSGKSQSHPRIQRDDLMNVRIPYMDNDTQRLFLRNIVKTETEVGKLRKKIPSLQSIIDNVFIARGLKSAESSSKPLALLSTWLIDVARYKALRLGARYNDFWNTHKGLLFEGLDSSIPVASLRSILKPACRKTVGKGLLTTPRILIDFEQVESKVGMIIDYENIVSEVGSSKLEFGDCDLLTNKLRPYLGYTILNEPELNLIGTTEFIPLEIRNSWKTSVEFIRYALLSTDYLGKSQLLMSGKEHPRIQLYDLLNMTIPHPLLEMQKEIVTEIKSQEQESNKIKKKIGKLISDLDIYIRDRLATS